jgi:succinate dehydrogenase / fumarate reductase flavoprotein subunit
MPVVPTCHYQMGGIPTHYSGRVVMPQNGMSMRSCRASTPAGECACASVHGANRLGTNSLLDLLVFGKSAGDLQSKISRPAGSSRFAEGCRRQNLARISALDNRKGGANVNETRLAMQRTMQDHAGVFRFKRYAERRCREDS